MPVINPMKRLYTRLRAAGFQTPYIKTVVLPEWWDDTAAATPAGYQQALLTLARNLGLDLASLQDPVAAVRLREFGPCKFKKASGVEPGDLELCRTLATRVAQLAAAAVTIPARPLPESADEVRQVILACGAPWVGLTELLDYCWSLGVPVLHLERFPTGVKKRPFGFAACVDGRPVMVLLKKELRPAWLLFILAHELGHLALGHVPDGGSLLDTNMANSDDEERAANAFAAELLTGSPPRRFYADGRWPNADQLAQYARRVGRQEQIDPGHVVLNYADAMGTEFFAVANAALKKLDPDPNAVGQVRAALAANLNWDQLPSDTSEFLMRVATDGPDRDPAC